MEKLEEIYIDNLNKTRRGIQRNNSEEHYLYKKELAPVTKLDLDKQLDSRPFSGNGRTNNKNNHKSAMSVDNSTNYNNFNNGQDDEDYDYNN